MKKSFSYPIIFMAGLTAVFVMLLAILNSATSEVIAFNNNIDLQKKILYVFDIDYDESNPDQINEIFKKSISEEKDSEGKIIYTASNEEGEVIGRAYPVGGAGLWGSIEAYAGISEDESTLLGIEFISQEETPGLGGRIDEVEFKEQFRGIDLTNLEDELIVFTPAPGGNVDAIAGATLTSQAVADFLNGDIKAILGGAR